MIWKNTPGPRPPRHEHCPRHENGAKNGKSAWRLTGNTFYYIEAGEKTGSRRRAATARTLRERPGVSNARGGESAPEEDLMEI